MSNILARFVVGVAYIVLSGCGGGESSPSSLSTSPAIFSADNAEDLAGSVMGVNDITEQPLPGVTEASGSNLKRVMIKIRARAQGADPVSCPGGGTVSRVTTGDIIPAASDVVTITYADCKVGEESVDGFWVTTYNALSGVTGVEPYSLDIDVDTDISVTLEGETYRLDGGFNSVLSAGDGITSEALTADSLSFETASGLGMTWQDLSVNTIQDVANGQLSEAFNGTVTASNYGSMRVVTNAPFVRSTGGTPTEGQMVITSGATETESQQSLRVTALDDGTGATLEIDVNGNGSYDDFVDVTDTVLWAEIEPPE